MQEKEKFLMTIDECKKYLEQAGFHEVQIHKKKGWLCVTAQK